MSFFEVDIYTPNRVVGRNIPADILSLPSDRGQIQILPEHTHLITQTNIGILSIQSGPEKKNYYIEEGICKVLHNKVIVLTSHCLEPEQIDLEDEKGQLKRVETLLLAGEGSDKEKFNALSLDIQRHRTKINLHNSSPK